MSYTELIFSNKDKVVLSTVKIENAHRGARVIWEKLITLYLDDTSLRKLVEEDKMNKLWDLVYDEKLNRNERICLLYTFDYAMLDRENFKELIEALKSMHISQQYDSLLEQAHIIEREFNNNKEIEYLIVNQNSISENYWDKDEEEDKNWFIFKEDCLNIKTDNKKRKIIDKYNKAIIKLDKIRRDLKDSMYSVDIIPIAFENLIENTTKEIKQLKNLRDFSTRLIIEDKNENIK